MFITINVRRCAPLIAALALIILSFFVLPSPESAETVSSSAERESVLLIDAGHGGEDGGASSADGLLESEVNLEIALKLEALAGLFGIETVMTRRSDQIDYPKEAATTAARKTADQKARLALFASTPGAVLVSIHQNAFPSSRPYGPQVLYARTDGSRELGELVHELLCRSVCPDNRRVAAPADNSIFLMKNAPRTAVLVECGFLSNPEEASLLSDGEYQNKIAAAILCGYIQYTKECT